MIMHWYHYLQFIIPGLMRTSCMFEFAIRGILFWNNAIMVIPHGRLKSPATGRLIQQAGKQERKYPNSPTGDEIICNKLLLLLLEYLNKALSLQWNRMHVMASQITSWSIVCLTAFLTYGKGNIQTLPLGPLQRMSFVINYLMSDLMTLPICSIVTTVKQHERHGVLLHWSLNYLFSRISRSPTKEISKLSSWRRNYLL